MLGGTALDGPGVLDGRVRPGDAPKRRPVISAATAYANAANAAAAAFAATPAYVAYQVDLVTRSGSQSVREQSAVVLRTRDGDASVRDASNALREGPPPALPAALDPLAEWAFYADFSRGHVVMHVAYEHPKEYAFPTPGASADVVAESIAGYDVRYAEGDSNHLELTPANAATRAFAAQPDHFVYRDVFVDPQTSLPSRVVLVAPDETLTLDYATVAEHWLLAHVAYDAVQHGRRSNVRYAVDAAYSAYGFPAAFSTPAPLP
jgi:hypothetical protein